MVNKFDMKVRHARKREDEDQYGLGRTGNDLLSRVLRRSTIGAKAFHCPVRDGMECFALARATGSSKFILKCS
jgi:hypothetical protein